MADGGSLRTLVVQLGLTAWQLRRLEHTCSPVWRLPRALSTARPGWRTTRPCALPHRALSGSAPSAGAAWSTRGCTAATTARVPACATVGVEVAVANTGGVASDEVVQLYVESRDARRRTELAQLGDCKRTGREDHRSSDLRDRPERAWESAGSLARARARPSSFASAIYHGLRFVQ